MGLLLIFIKRTHKKNLLKKFIKRYFNIHHMNFLLSPFDVSIKYPYELSNSYYGIK